MSENKVDNLLWPWYCQLWTAVTGPKLQVRDVWCPPEPGVDGAGSVVHDAYLARMWMEQGLSSQGSPGPGEFNIDHWLMNMH